MVVRLSGSVTFVKDEQPAVEEKAPEEKEARVTQLDLSTELNKNKPKQAVRETAPQPTVTREKDIEGPTKD